MIQNINTFVITKKNYFLFATLTVGYLNRGKLDYFIKSITNLLLYGNIKKQIISRLFSISMFFPYFRNKVEEKLTPVRENIKKDIINAQPTLRVVKLPEEGISYTKIMQNLSSFVNNDNKFYTNKKLSGTLYNIPDENEKHLLKNCMDYYYKTNPLHADIYPSLISMEKDIISMTKNILNCPADKGMGSLTTGGTESIILALFGYREYAKKYKNINYPEAIAPSTVHPAFDKGCYYLGIKLRKIQVDNKNNLNKLQLRLAINENTILLIGSAPSFPHGLMDDFNYLSYLANIHQLPLHVDACLGGFVLSFLDKDEPLFTDLNNAWDFRNPFVTSISIDTHKYGCCPKSSSVIIFKEEKMFECCYFIQNSWSGGIYATTNITGSRSGLSIAWTWSILNSLGYNKLKKQAENISNNVKKIKNSFANDADIFVYGEPRVCVVAFGSNTLNIYKISQKLKEEGWNLNELQNPPSFHLCVTNCHNDEIIDEFIKSLKSIVDLLINEKLNKNKTNSISNDEQCGSIYGTTQRVPDKSVIDKVVTSYLNCLHKELT